MALKACSLVVEWAQGLGLDDLWLRIVPGNQRSVGLAERLGFTPDIRQGKDYVDAAGGVHRTQRYLIAQNFAPPRTEPLRSPGGGAY